MGFGAGVAPDMGSTQGMQRKQVPGRAHGAGRTVLKHGSVGEAWADARSVYPRAEEVLRTAAPVQHIVEHDACTELQRRQGGKVNARFRAALHTLAQRQPGPARQRLHAENPAR